MISAPMIIALSAERGPENSVDDQDVHMQQFDWTESQCHGIHIRVHGEILTTIARGRHNFNDYSARATYSTCVIV